MAFDGVLAVHSNHKMSARGYGNHWNSGNIGSVKTVAGATCFTRLTNCCSGNVRGEAEARNEILQYCVLIQGLISHLDTD